MSSIFVWIIATSMCSLAFLVWGLLFFFAKRSPMERLARRRFGIASAVYLFGWLTLAIILGNAGVFQASATTKFPAIVLGIALPLGIGMAVLQRSTVLNSVIEAVPIPWLAGIQLYRAFGFIFLALYATGRLPGEFAIPAGIGDVAVGVLAPVVGYLFSKGFRLSCFAVLGWNILGILDLVVSVALGFLSSPGPFQVLALETPNEIITAFPLVLVPVFAVPLSILLHFATLRRLKAMAGVLCAGQSAVLCSGIKSS